MPERHLVEKARHRTHFLDARESGNTLSNRNRVKSMMESFLLLRPNYLASEPENIPAGMTNVKHPGRFLTAAVGDGISDDTSAIQAIVNHAASSKNNKVFFPRGEYLVSSNIAMHPWPRWNFTEHRAVSQLSSPRLLMFFKFTMLHQ